MRCNTFKSVLSFFLFLCLKILFMENIGILAQNDTTLIPVNVGVILDLSDDWNGNIWLSCINMALSDFYATHGDYKTRLNLTIRDSKKDVAGAAYSAALDLIKTVEVEAIIGPTTSKQANFVIELGVEARVPILSFSATSPSLSSIRNPYFFRVAQNDATQVNAISAIIQTFGWREAVPIYMDNEYGEGIIPYLTDALLAVDARVPYRSAISPSATDDQIVEELYKLMTMQTRVFIVHMYRSLGARLFAKAKENGMMGEGYVWIMTNGLTAELLSSPIHSVTDTMQGVLGIKNHVPRTKELKDFRLRWKRKFHRDNPDIIDAELDIYGLWAYDATTTLALAIEKVGTTNHGFQRANVSGNSSINQLNVSLNGTNLLKALSNTSFKGLAGEYLFNIDRLLQSSIFEIVNVNGNTGRNIGFWTQSEGLVKKLNPGANLTPTFSTVIFPGDTKVVPKGWQIPTNDQKRLRIGVPVKHRFKEFVAVNKDHTSNITNVAGYCIDLFEVAVQALPYALPFDYVPFETPDGQPAGSYNDLVHQVYLKKYDAVVGDVTILYNRSLYIDYTLPYTESGISMIVPIVDRRSKNAWVFLKPLTLDLWLTSLLFFIFIGFTVWVLEHRINEDFRGPASNQASTSFWFSFSVMFFAQRERVINNLSRIVIVIWCFVVLILTQSYTANLASLLTVQLMQPIVTDFYELIKKDEYVGYKKKSFVREILLGLGFDGSKLLEYESEEECDKLLSDGSGNGGIAAAFDEVPYIRIFISKHHSKYTVIGPTFKTNGFGFVFPKGSPLAPDISRAILNVTGGIKMKKIEDFWFPKQTNWSDSSDSDSSHNLSVTSFWGLFLIAGIAALSALVIFVVMFVYQEKRVLFNPSNPTASIWTRLGNLFRTFNQKDLSSQAFRRNAEPNCRSEINLPSMNRPSPSQCPGESSTVGYDSNPNSKAPEEEEIDGVDELTNPNQVIPTAF